MEAILIPIVALIVWLCTGIKIIHQQKAGIVELLGKYSKTIHAGLNWIPPVPFGAIVGEVTLRITEITAPVEVKTSDNVFVTMPMTLMIRVVDGAEQESFYKLERPAEQIKTWVLNIVRGEVNKMTLNELFSDRSAIEKGVHEHLAQQLAEYGYELVNLLVEQPTVSQEVQESFNRVIAATREKEAAVLEGEAQRIKIVAAANAESEAQVARAHGIAEARKTIADAYADSVKNITEKNPHAEIAGLLDLLVTANRIDALRDIGRNGNLVIMDTAEPGKALQALLAKSLKVGGAD